MIYYYAAIFVIFFSYHWNSGYWISTISNYYID